MALIQWTENLSVGITSIDQEHQKLIKMINALNQAMLQKQGKEMVAKVINGLVSYTSVHFSNEERLFEKHKYPDANMHIIEHKAFIRKVREFNDSYTSGNTRLSIDILNFLSDWLSKHIQGTDKKYSAFLIAKGAK